MKWRWLPFFCFLLAGLASGSAQTDVLPVENLAIPKTLGKIETRFQGQSGRWIIHIQDVHSQLTAQENIAALVEHLHELYGIDTVAIEGGWSATNYPKIRALPSSQAKQLLARGLLEQDEISGPAYAAMFAQTPIKLVGIEEEPLYEANRKIYLEYLKHRDEIIKRYEALQEKIFSEKQTVYNPELQVFDHHLMTFRAGKNAEKFIPALVEKSEAMGVDLTELRQIDIFRQMLTLEESIKKDVLESEAKRLLTSYKIPSDRFEEFIMSGKVPEEQLAHYPEVRKYREILKIETTLNHREFFNEIEEAIRRFKNRLFTTPEEKALDKKSEALMAAGQIMLMEATPDDLKHYDENKTAIDADIAAAGLENALVLGLSFYEKAKARDQVFFNRVTTDPELSGNIAVVTGGFHTEGLSALLEGANISHFVITPELGEDFQPNEKLYFERMKEELPSEQTLSNARNRFLTPRFENAFIDEMPEVGRDKNIPLAIKHVMPTGAEAASVALETEKPEVSAAFAQMTDAEKAALVEEYRKMQTGKLRVVTIIKASVLKGLLEEKVSDKPLALTILKQEILPQRENTLLIVPDLANEEVDALLLSLTGDKATVKRGFATIELTLQKERAKPLGKDTLIGVVDPEFKGEGANAILKPRPIVFLVLRPLLEQKDARLIAVRDFDELSWLQAVVFEDYLREGVFEKFV